MDSRTPQWLSTEGAARALGITNRTLYRLIDEGGLPAYKFGRVIRLQRHEVEDFVARARVVPGTLGHLHPGGQSSSEDSVTAEDAPGALDEVDVPDED